MSNIAVRKNGNAPVPTAAPAMPAGYAEWDPYKMMRDFMRWDPFREMTPYFNANEGATAFFPAFEVKETPEAYSFKADLPGVKPEDVEVTMTGSRLTISGKREAEHREKNDTFYAYERTYGHFSRAFTMPGGADADHIKAELRDGVLNVMVPKRPEVQPKKVTVQTEPSKKS